MIFWLNIAKTITIIEFGLVALIILLTYLLKIFSYFLLKRKRMITAQVKNYLIYIEREHNYHLTFPSNGKNLAIILPMFKQLTFQYSQQTKLSLFEKIILPLARKAANSRRWKQRFYAAEAFGYQLCEGDENLLKKLIVDPIPIVCLMALESSLNQQVDEAIILAIKQIAAERKLNQAIYLPAFAKASTITISLITKMLQEVTEPYLRKTCYYILLQLPIININWAIKKDLISHNKELQIAALRYITYSKPDNTFSILTKHLHDKHWEIRMVSVQGLTKIQDEKALDYLALALRDSSWWVRISAANALKERGEKGIALLNAQSPTIDRFAYEVSQQVLAIDQETKW